jgi:signal transduction histidine kinase
MNSLTDLPQTFRHQTVLALNQFGQAVTSSLNIQEVLDRVLVEVTALLNAEGVAILLPEGDELVFVAVCGLGAIQLKGARIPNDVGVVGHVLQTGEAVWLNSTGSNVPGLTIYRQVEDTSEFHSESLLAAPLIQGGETIGVLEAAHSRTDGLTPNDLPILLAAANWVSIAISNAQLHQQAQKLREEQASLEERTRLARDLHDAVTQSLYSMSVLAGAWRRQIETGALQPTLEHIAELGDLAQNALREVRLIIYELRSSELQEEGLIGALYHRLETVEQRAGIQARLIVTDDAGRPHPLPADGRDAMVAFYRLPPDLELGLYRFAQEALNNALKHSGASIVNVRILMRETTLSLVVEDNGVGFDSQERPAAGHGFGLHGLKERAQQLGGVFSISSTPGKGTIVRIDDVPYCPTGIEETSR